MPSDLRVKTVAAVTGASENPAESKATSFTQPAHAPPPRAAPAIPNPQLRLDPALGLVVIEFRDASGAVASSIPSQRQLEAYRMWQQGQSAPTAPAPAAEPAADTTPAVHHPTTGKV